jgi:hypothetical protein
VQLLQLNVEGRTDAIANESRFSRKLLSSDLAKRRLKKAFQYVLRDTGYIVAVILM